MRVIKKENVKNNKVTANINKLAGNKEMDDTGIEDSDPNKRSSSKIGQSYSIVTQEIPLNNITATDITDISEGITVNGIDESDAINKNTVAYNNGVSDLDGRNSFSFKIIIDILS